MKILRLNQKDRMRGKIVFLVIYLLLGIKISHGQHTIIKGVVTDSISGEGLPYVSLIIKGTSMGTSTDLDGRFSLSISAPGGLLEISYVGYQTKKVKITAGESHNLRIRLSQTSLSLGEVIVRPKKEKYKRKGNPAVELVRQVIARKEQHSPYDHDYFSYDKYEKVMVAKNEYGAKDGKKGKSTKFDFLKDFVDTLEVGTTILPISEKERLETVLYRKNPKSEKRLVQGSKSSGVDEMLSRDGVQQFLNEVFHEVDINKNNIPLFLQRFVSPLSSIGTFYKYYLLDTLDIDSQPCVDLGFVPFNSESFGFTGHLFVTLDSTFFVKRAVLNVAKDINLNFVSRMTITQTFERLPDSTRVVTKDDISVDFKLFEGAKGFYARRLNIYSGHSFDKPANNLLAVFEEDAPVLTQEKAYERPESFWINARPDEAVKKNSNSLDDMMTKLRSVPFYAVTEKILSTIVSGYTPLVKDPLRNKFELG